MDQATTFKLLRAAQQDVQSPAQHPVSFPSLLPFSPHVVGPPALTQPTQHSNTVLINNTFKEFSRSYLMCFMSFSIQMCKAKQGEL